jgi:GNAT acetyltransferase-like protein
MPEISIRVVPASAIDLTEHTRFQQAAFTRRFTFLPASTIQTEGYYAWKYRTPAGTARIAQAFEDDKLVGSASAVPVRFASCQFDVWQLCDLATAANLRGRGVLTSCLKHLLADIGKDAPVYCLPNALSYSPLLRAGFAEAGWLRWHVTARPLLHWSAQRNRAQRCAEQMENLAFAGPGLDLFDAATLDWRFRARPDLSYRILELAGRDGCSIAVLRSLGRRLRTAVLVGLRLTPAVDLPGLAEVLERSMKSRREVALLTLCQNAPPWRSHSYRIPEYFSPRRFPIVAMNFGPSATSFTAAEWDVL